MSAVPLRPLDRPPSFRLAGTEPGRVDLESADGARAWIFPLEADIIRVLVAPGGRLNAPRTWTLAPGADDSPAEGRDRFDLSGFSCPSPAISEAGGVLTVETAALRLEVMLEGLRCRWSALGADGAWEKIARDRPTQAYDFGWWDGRPRHYLVREAGEIYVGLGERTGGMDRAGRRFRLSNTDALGYDARSSDPLYKHIPFYITRRPGSGTCFGVFYDTLADCDFDFGQELDNYHGFFRSFAADAGDLDYYVIAGPRPDQVTRRFTWLTGRPAFPPRWSLGYSGSSMAYADAPDAQRRLAGFLDACRARDLPCSSFHLSSGYTAIGPNRYVFTWNRDRFPDPAGFARSYAGAGVRVLANVKPCLLTDHPRFAEAAALGLFLKDPDGRPHLDQFWGGSGAHLDFTRPETAGWWGRQVREQLLEVGIAATWNDNNEYEVKSPAAQAHGFGAPFPARDARPLQALLMMRASRDAQLAFAPDRRPMLISRSGGAGMQRYVQTWSGDNLTSWDTLRWNLPMGLGLALSGVSNSGHDVGGFAGPAPDAELLHRWVQFGVLTPRFSIHSWNDDGTVNEPWMHPEIEGHVRDLIRLRVRLEPHLYDLVHRHHIRYEAMVRPLAYDFPEDPEAWRDETTMMIGEALLAAPILEAGVRTREVRLPRGADWICFWSGRRAPGGARVRRAAPGAKPILFGKVGCAVPLNLARPAFGAARDVRGLMLFPPEGEGAAQGEVFEDDGESFAYREGRHGAWAWRMTARADVIEVAVEARGQGPAPRPVLRVPPGERRPLRLRA